MITTEQMSQLLRPEEGEMRQVLGTQVRILQRGKDNGGSHSTYIVTVPTDQGPPPHRHEGFDESFYVLEGQLEVFMDGQLHTVSVGSFVNFPRGSVHTFRNSHIQPAKFLGIANPAGHERFFDRADQLPVPPNVEQVMELCTGEGIELLLD